MSRAGLLRLKKLYVLFPGVEVAPIFQGAGWFVELLNGMLHAHTYSLLIGSTFSRNRLLNIALTKCTIGVPRAGVVDITSTTCPYAQNEFEALSRV